MRWNDVEDLDDDPASVGGAMSKWPLQTAWWACRDIRAAQYDPNVLQVLMDKNVSRLKRLEDAARQVGIEPEKLKQRRLALQGASPDDLENALRTQYKNEYDTPGAHSGCPFEREGNDFACLRCPVAGQALDQLRDEIKQLGDFQ